MSDPRIKLLLPRGTITTTGQLTLDQIDSTGINWEEYEIREGEYVYLTKQQALELLKDLTTSLKKTT